MPGPHGACPKNVSPLRASSLRIACVIHVQVARSTSLPPLEESIQCRPVDSGVACGARNVVSSSAVEPVEITRFELSEHAPTGGAIPLAKIFITLCRTGGIDRRIIAERDLLRANRGARLEHDYHVLDRVLQLADVAPPGMRGQRPERVRGKRGRRRLGAAMTDPIQVQEMLCQNRDILGPLA